MRPEVFDLQDLRVPVDEEDEQLLAMFPARRESALNEMYLVRRGGETYLIRKEDVARLRKALTALAEFTMRAAAVMGLCLSAYCWVHSVGRPWVWLAVGELCLIGCLIKPVYKFYNT